MDASFILKAQDHAKALTVEGSFSTLTYGIGSLERAGPLSEADLTRLRQFVVRASNLERKLSK